MRGYHFFMKFWHSFRIGFWVGLFFLFLCGSVLFCIWLANPSLFPF